MGQWIWFAVLCCLLFARQSTCCADESQRCVRLVPSQIEDGRVRTLTRRSLDVPSQLNISKAWAGLVCVSGGGPADEILRYRHAYHLRRALQQSSSVSDDLWPEEQEARRSVLRFTPPMYFDGVLLKVNDAAGHTRLRWLIDFDFDGSLADESQHVVRPAFTDPLNISKESQVLQLYDSPAGLELRNENVAAAAEPPDNNVQVRSVSKSVPLPASLEKLRRELHQLDEPSQRKSHLDRVVAAADRLIAELQLHQSPDAKLTDNLSVTLADALYRKGRALGYMELPDVVAVHPVDDPELLQQQFEECFQQLGRLVDTTKPQYILLRVRRERRRGRFGVALQLVDHYEATHPTPVWRNKKRFDLYRELGSEFFASQAAARLRLQADEVPGFRRAEF